MPYTIMTEACKGTTACKKICPADAIKGTQKKLHTIDPVLCIECGACGKVCANAAIKDSLGNICIRVKRAEWEKPQIDNKKCMSCNLCIDICPVACLALSGAMGKNKHGRPYLKDDKVCIGCSFCALECPVDAIVMIPPAAG